MDMCICYFILYVFGWGISKSLNDVCMVGNINVGFINLC